MERPSLFRNKSGIAILGLLLTPAVSLAGNGGSILYRPLANAVPTTGGMALVVLAALLGLIGFRMMKQREQAGTNWLVAAIAVSAMVSAGSGVKLINDAYAIPSVYPMTNEGGGVVDLPSSGGCWIVQNQTTVTQQIIDVIPDNPGVVLGACSNGGAPLANGGAYRGTCNDDPGTILGEAEICDIEISYQKI
ncbi:MAG: midcut-by-XrtH protein [bacterium]